MGGKKSDKKKKITLPSSGLAEDILENLKLEASEDSVEESELEGEAAPEVFTRLVNFVLGREEYGVPIEEVREIVRVKDITLVPNTPGYVLGVINLRGAIVPVVDMGLKLGMDGVEPDYFSRIMIVDHEGEWIGLLVDRVARVTTVGSSMIQAPPRENEADTPDYVTGLANLDGRMVIMMDLITAVSPEPL